MKLDRHKKRHRRHLRVRRKVKGTAERPRLYVRKSLKHLYCFLVDDSPEQGSRTLAAFTTAKKDAGGKSHRNIASAKELGADVGKALQERGVNNIVFDRGGYQYHGVVKTLAESIRESGVQF